MSDAPTYIVPTCEFCGADKPRLFVPTRWGLICEMCVEVAVEVVMDAMTRKASRKRGDTVDNHRTKRVLRVAA